MKYTLKTRLVGAALLAAIALIFIPSFFKDKEVAPVSTKTQIPPKPSITAEEFKSPQPVAGIEPAAAPETMFMPDQQTDAATGQADEATGKVDPANPSAPLGTATGTAVVPPSASTSQSATSLASKAVSSVASSAKISKQTTSASNTTTGATPKAHLTEKGIPDAWMIQVGSFATKTAADKVRDQLQAKGLKAFDRKVSNISGVAAKVFVGPVLDKAQAATLKKQVDHELKVNSIIVKFQP